MKISLGYQIPSFTYPGGPAAIFDTVVAQAFGAGNLKGCHRALVQGLYVAIGLTPPLMALVLATPSWLAHFGVNPTVLRVSSST